MYIICTYSYKYEIYNIYREVQQQRIEAELRFFEERYRAPVPLDKEDAKTSLSVSSTRLMVVSQKRTGPAVRHSCQA